MEKISSNEGWIPASPDEGWSLGYGRELRDFVKRIAGSGRPPESDLDLAIDIDADTVRRICFGGRKGRGDRDTKVMRQGRLFSPDESVGYSPTLIIL